MASPRLDVRPLSRLAVSFHKSSSEDIRRRPGGAGNLFVNSSSASVPDSEPPLGDAPARDFSTETRS